jgi:hypothetical protein
MNQKIGVQVIAAFMVLTMVLSVFVMLFGGNSPDNTEDQASYLPDEQFNIAGKQVVHGFNSITDALQMSTPDIYLAEFINMEYINATDSQPWYEQLSANLTFIAPLNKSEIDHVYQTSTKQMYLGQSYNGFILLSTMSPKKTPLNYIPSYSRDGQYIILERIDINGFNVMGDPTILASSLESTEAVLSILENWTIPQTAYDTFRPVLNHSDDHSEFQVVFNMMFYPDHFTDLYYLGLHKNDDGSFTRTTIYQNPTTDAVSHINNISMNSQELGYTDYTVTEDGDIIKVVASGEFMLVTAGDI